MKNGNDFQGADFDDDIMAGGPNGGQIEEIIDEEELMLLKEMKDLKRNYRDNFDKLKNFKVEVADIQANIDNTKQQLIYNFENWYLQEFEPGGEGAELNYAEEGEGLTTVKGATKAAGTFQAYKGDSLVGEDVDDDAMAFIRAKKKVDSLHKAKKLEKQRPGLR